MEEKVARDMLKCIRCGVCCIVVPCDLTKILDETEICSNLIIHKEGYTSCKCVKENENVFNEGCLIRRSKEVYEYYKAQAEEKAGIRLVGIK